LKHFRAALELDKAVNHAFDLDQGKVEGRLGIGETDGTAEVAAAGYFDESQAGMLSVLRAKAAVLRTPSDHLCAEPKRFLAGLIERQRLEIHCCVRTQQHLVLAVAGTFFTQDDSVIADDYVGRQGAKTLRANAQGAFYYLALFAGLYIQAAPPE